MAEEAHLAAVDGGVLELPGEGNNNPEIRPHVLRQGTQFTVFANFMEHCALRHRQPEHVMAFLLAALHTVGFFDEQQRLVVRGRFAPRNFEVTLQGYVPPI